MKFIKIITVLSLAAAVIYQRFVPDELKIEIPVSLTGMRTVRVSGDEWIYYKIYDKTGETTGFFKQNKSVKNFFCYHIR